MGTYDREWAGLISEIWELRHVQAWTWSLQSTRCLWRIDRAAARKCRHSSEKNTQTSVSDSHIGANLSAKRRIRVQVLRLICNLSVVHLQRFRGFTAAKSCLVYSSCLVIIGSVAAVWFALVFTE